MFGEKKYVFETNDTRMIRRLRNLFLSLLSVSILYTILCLILLLVSKQENQTTRETFFKSSPDLIVVFTGDNGRIPYAIKLAKEFNQTNILISGVHTKNNVDRILKDIDISSGLNPNFLEIDYDAKNTYENVVRTLEFIRDRKDIKEVIIISHDYHILRIKAIFENLTNKHDNYHFYYSGVNSNLSEIRNIKIIYKEVFKFLRTLAFLSLGDID